MSPPLPTPPPPSLALLAVVSRMQPVPLRRPERQAAVVIALSLSATATLLLTAGRSVADDSWPLATVLLALFVTRVLAATLPPRGMVLPRPQGPLAKTVLTVLGVVGATVTHGSSSALPLAPWPCVLLATAAWLIPTTVAAWVLGGVARQWRVLREIAGAASASAALVLLVVCERGDAAHVIAAHGGILLTLPALGVCAAMAAVRQPLRR